MSIVQSAGGSNQHNAAGIVRPIYSAVVSTVVLVRVRVPVSALLVQTGYSLGTIFAIYFLSPDYHFFATEREAATGRFRRAHASIREHAESIRIQRRRAIRAATRRRPDGADIRNLAPAIQAEHVRGNFLDRCAWLQSR